MPASRPLIEQLAAEHAEHLRWLRRRTRGRLDPDAAEDVLQGAYASALRDLQRSGASAPPHFASADKARAWLRTIAVNLVRDDERRRRRRPPVALPCEPSRAPRMAGRCDDAGVDVEDDALRVVAREADRRVIARAIEALPAEHRQILKLRYAEDLDPNAIMLLENITRRQWDGRHDRALKALARSLARLHVGADCRRTRQLMRRSPEALLRRGGGSRPARLHVESCLACGAFARTTRSALAALPIPVSIEPWRWQLLEYFNVERTPAESAGVAAPPSGAAPSSAGLVVKQLALAGVVLATAAAGIALLAGDAAEVVKRPTRSAGSAPADPVGSRASWADHATDRRALERSARQLAVARRNRSAPAP